MNVFIEVVFIDDEQCLIDIYKQFAKKFLEPQIFKMFFQDSNSAYEYLEKNSRTKLVLSDYDMPGKNGIDIYNLLCEKNENCIFVLLSGSSFRFGEKRDSKIEFINESKPFKIPKLLQLLTNCIKKLEGGDLNQQESTLCLCRESK